MDPERKDDIPGLEALKTGDLMILFSRFRDLPDEQMRHIAEYVEAVTRLSQFVRPRTPSRSGRARRTAIGATARRGPEASGARFSARRGWRITASTRCKAREAGSRPARQAKHPILTGIRDGAVWGPTDVYTVANPLPGDSTPLLLGEVLEGMKEGDKPAAGLQNEPELPVAWTKSYKGGRVFTTTMGSSQDLENAAFRRLLVDAAYWAMGQEKKIRAKGRGDIVGPYNPTPFGFGTHLKGRRPDEY